MLDKRHLTKGFILIHHSAAVRAATGHVATTVKEKRPLMTAQIQLAFLFLCSPELHTWEWCHLP